MIYRLVAISALTTFIGGIGLPANAQPPGPIGRDGSHHGNGRHNRNVISVGSPTHNRGYQHTNNGNAGGMNPVQNALCRHVTVCTISQKVNIVQPEKPTAVPPPAPVQALPQTVVVPQSITRPERPAPQQPAPQQPAPERPAPHQPAPQQPAPARGPFMYMGPDGFMLMAPDSAAGFGTSERTGSFHLPFGFFG